jgi:hypothetical protein
VVLLVVSLRLPLAVENLTDGTPDRQPIAFYQLGYGVAAFGVGALQNVGVALPAIFAASGAVAVIMGYLSLVVAYRRPSPASLHPLPVQRQSISGHDDVQVFPRKPGFVGAQWALFKS